MLPDLSAHLFLRALQLAPLLHLLRAPQSQVLLVLQLVLRRVDQLAPRFRVLRVHRFRVLRVPRFLRALQLALLLHLLRAPRSQVHQALQSRQAHQSVLHRALQLALHLQLVRTPLQLIYVGWAKGFICNSFLKMANGFPRMSLK